MHESQDFFRPTGDSSQRPMKTYTVVFLIAALSSLLMTPLIIRMSHAFGLVDRPGVRKVHKTPIPRVGGIAIALPFFLATLPVLQLDNDVSRQFHAMMFEVSFFLIASAVVFVMGYLDDAYGLRVRTKFLVQLAAATAVYAAGVRIEIFNVFNLGTIDLGWLSFPLTMLWIVGITNAINLLDGLDGLAAGSTAITCGLLAFFAVMQGDQVMAVVSLALAGALSCFLYFNFNPAKIFLGDSGSQFIGFSVATAAAMTANKAQTAVAIMLPMLALGVPIFDTLLSMMRRFLGRRSLFGPDRGHIHHRLLERGLSHKRVVLTLYAIHAAAALVGVFISVQRDPRTMLVFAAAFILLAAVFRWSGVFTVRESFNRLRANRIHSLNVKEESRLVEFTLLSLAETQSFERFWSTFCDFAERLGVTHVALVSTCRLRGTRALEWQKPGSPGDGTRDVSATLDLPGRQAGQRHSFRVRLTKVESLESAARRISCLSRVLDEPAASSALNSDLASTGPPMPWRRFSSAGRRIAGR